MPLKDKEQERAYQAQYRISNRERLKEYRRLRYPATKEQQRAYYLKNKAHLKERRRIYDLRTKEMKRRHDKKHYAKYRDRERAKRRERYLANREKVIPKCREYYSNNKASILAARSAKWQVKAHREKVYAQRRNKIGDSIEFRIKERLRLRITEAVRNQNAFKSKRTIALLGCSIASFRIYIESKLQPGMTWENIHLDHVVPCALFDLTKEEHQKICFHFSNYQPLLAADNIRKGAKILHPTQIGLPLPA